MSKELNDLLTQLKRRPIYIINGKWIKKPKIDIYTHPRVTLEDYLFGRCPHIVSLTRVNGQIVGQPDRLSVSSRRSGRAIIIAEYS